MRKTRALPLSILLLLVSIPVLHVVLVIYDWVQFSAIPLRGKKLRIPRYTQRFRDAKFSGSDEIERDVIRERGQVVPAQVMRPPVTTSNTSFAVVTMYANVGPSKRDTFTSNIDGFAIYGITNLIEYTSHHGYPFFFHHAPGLVATDSFTSLYWSKLTLLEHYMSVSPPFSWLLWTDADVLIMRPEIPLSSFVDGISPQYHVAVVLECGRANFDYLRQWGPRSGFFFVRNSDKAREFLNAWRSLRGAWEKSLTPEQDALEQLLADQAWWPSVYVYPSNVLHCYAECADEETFSVHFPNTQRKTCMAQWWRELFGDAAGSAGRHP
ncbi:hypothetical protein M427DRAFT_334965 [Gonapodya prolifera JEL478]|uniref:Glycosyltransferase family 34 protein n=1 Tax=Gonapodya prolifera (strain JEL478) TaxID=1344416 RepID=A0A139ADI4_GONPJ|nr:hypothetical protein M427DRAFT_334965 [Gonapodya prolifera JEL478]|eukprot:KXS14830.1 hypothetical protein M427DRAFT_334965 [Gonapodya prolifera JEL478]